MIFFSSINGEFLSSEESVEQLLQDRGLAYGHGLFETMALRCGQIPLLQQHLHRLTADAPKLGINPSFESVEACVTAFITSLSEKDIKDVVVKVMLTAGVGGRGYQSPSTVLPHIICASSPLVTDLHDQQLNGINLWRCHYQLPLNPRLAGIKHLNRLDQVLARNECDTAGYEDGVMFATDGNLIETTCANIFIKTDEGWLTPALDNAGVNGVMRTLLLETIFPALKLPVSCRAITADELRCCTEGFICNAVRGLVPILSITDSYEQYNLKMAAGAETKRLQSHLNNNYVGF